MQQILLPRNRWLQEDGIDRYDTELPWNMTGRATWSTPYIHLYLVNIVYKFESSRRNSVFHQNASCNTVIITVKCGATWSTGCIWFFVKSCKWFERLLTFGAKYYMVHFSQGSPGTGYLSHGSSATGAHLSQGSPVTGAHLSQGSPVT